MADNSTDSSTPDLSQILPDYLNLPPHLSAHKYFFVCTLTVAAWDTLVLSPRAWRLFRTKEWPPLKTLFHFLRLSMPIEFTIVGVAFFDTKWSQSQCSHFFLFEPICTAVLAACSIVHVIRINAIYEKNRNVLYGTGGRFKSSSPPSAVASTNLRPSRMAKDVTRSPRGIGSEFTGFPLHCLFCAHLK